MSPAGPCSRPPWTTWRTTWSCAAPSTRPGPASFDSVSCDSDSSTCVEEYSVVTVLPRRASSDSFRPVELRAATIPARRPCAPTTSRSATSATRSTRAGAARGASLSGRREVPMPRRASRGAGAPTRVEGDRDLGAEGGECASSDAWSRRLCKTGGSAPRTPCSWPSTPSSAFLYMASR